MPFPLILKTYGNRSGPEKFIQAGNKVFSDEYPDAEVFANRTLALKRAKDIALPYHISIAIIAFYGKRSERIIAKVHPDLTVEHFTPEHEQW